MTRPVILIPTDYYLPGFMAGGVVRSLANLVEELGDEFAFKIVSRDRDANQKMPYTSVSGGQWNQVGKAAVYYVPPTWTGLGRLFRLLRTEPHDILYLNSFFSSMFSIYPLILKRLGLVKPRRVVLAPRGEFAPGALAIKSEKKKLFVALSKMVGMHRNIRWHASTDIEGAEIRGIFGESVPVAVALDISEPEGGESRPLHRSPKRPGKLNIIFLSRISEKKNLDGAIEMLGNMSEGDINFRIYGPIDNSAYWTSCQGKMVNLPPNVVATYHGAVEHDDVQHVMGENHVFFLPTRGENYGHVIREALAAGCIVIISDRTPWSDVQRQGGGWALALERPDMFVEALRQCLYMGESEFRRRAAQARMMVCGEDRRAEVVGRNYLVFQHPAC